MFAGDNTDNRGELLFDESLTSEEKRDLSIFLMRFNNRSKLNLGGVLRYMFCNGERKTFENGNLVPCILT